MNYNENNQFATVTDIRISKDIKTVTTVFHMLKTLSRNAEYIYKKTQIKLTGMKTKMSEMKNAVGGIIGE